MPEQPYATLEDLAEYLGVDPEALPDDADRLLIRASEIVDEAAMQRIDLRTETHAQAAKLATCAQVEFWQTVGEEREARGPIRAYTAGRVQIQYETGAAPAYLAPRARRYLLMAGLLYRGAAMR